MPRNSIQFAALPYRSFGDGSVEVMLITSRGTGRWVIPKGWPIKGRKPHGSAGQEAYEEAGLIGHMAKEPLGCFGYDKLSKGGVSVNVTVAVFPMKVEGQLAEWPERGQRECSWFSPDEAAALVAEPGLAEMIRTFPRHIERTGRLAVSAPAPAFA